MITLVCTNISIALRLLEKVPYNSTSTKITLTLFYVKSNINLSCLDSTVIDVKAKRRHESRSLWYRRIFLRKALVFIELSSNISLWAVVLKWLKYLPSSWELFQWILRVSEPLGCRTRQLKMQNTKTPSSRRPPFCLNAKLVKRAETHG